MNARSDQDTNIGWIKSELDETLSLARQALEVYVENPNDEAQLRFVSTHMHQIVGTLQLVELYGASLLAEETELVVNDLIEGKIKQLDDAYEVVMRAILQLPTYLDHIQQGFKDNPVNLLPILNDLRTTRGQQLLSEHAFFSPDLDVLPDAQAASAPHSTEELPLFAKKLRPLYQTGLVGLFRNKDVQKNLKLLATVIKQLENSVATDKAKQLFWVCGGIIEGLYNKGLEANISLKSLLGQVDRLIKTLIDGGEQALSEAITKELLKNLLYYVAQTEAKGARVNELKKAFNLNKILPAGDAKSAEAHEQMTGFGADVIKNVSKAIKEDMLSIKDSLDLFVRSDDSPLSDLEPMCEKLRSVADTLGLLGMGKLRKLIKEQEQVVNNIMNSDGDLDDSVIMGIASALLFVESSINDLRLANIEDDQDQDQIQDTKLLPDSEYNQLVDLTITEAKSVLARVKDAFIAFAADNTNYELLEGTPDLINEIKGAFVIVSFGRAADLINSCNKYITEKLLANKSTPEKDELDALADVISGIEYFLENFAQDSNGARKSLDIAQESLIKLGFPPEHVEPVSDDGASQTVDKIDLESLENMPAPEKAEPPVETQSEAPAEKAEISFIEEEEDEGPDEEILEIFLEEAEEEFASITEQLVNWEANLSDDNALASLRRSYHTLKGSGRIVGALEIGEFAWAIESMLNRVIDKAIEATPVLFTLMKQAKDVLPELIDQVRGKGAPASDIQTIADNAHKLTKGEDIDLDATPAAAKPADVAAVVSEQGESKAAAYDPVLVEIFTNETATHISAIRQFIAQCQENGLPCKVNNDLIRALHTLHGSAHMANVHDIADLSDQLEKYAKLVLENQTEISEDVITLLLDSVNAIEAMIGNLSEGNAAIENKDGLIDRSAALYNAELSVQKERLGGADQDTESETTIDEELIKIYLLEADEILEQTNAVISGWSQSPELTDELRRHMHTLKGGAKIANLPDIADVSDHLENVLNKFVDQQITVSEKLTETVEQAHQWLIDAFDLKRSGTPATQSLVLAKVELLKQFERLLAGFTGDETETVQQTDLSIADTELEMLGTDEELVLIFVNEAQEILSNTQEILSQLPQQLDNLKLTEDLQRAMHMLKGGARMAKITPIGDIAQNIEAILMMVIEGALQLNQNMLQSIQTATNWTAEAIESLKNNQPASANDALITELQAHTQTPPALDDGLEDVTVEEISLELDADETSGLTLDETDIAPEEKIELTDFDSSWETEESEEDSYDDDLADIFLEEAAEILHTMDDLLNQWSGDPENSEVLQEVLRALHTLKGGARMANIAPIGDLTHSIETVLEKITGGHLTATQELVAVVHTAYDWLSTALDNIRRSEPLSSVEHLIDEIEISVGLKQREEVADVVETIETTEEAQTITPETSTGDEQSDRLSAVFAVENLDEAEISDFEMAEFTEEQKAEKAEKQSSQTSKEQVKVSAELLDLLINNAGEVTIYRSRVDQQLSAIGYNLTEFDQTIARIGEQLRKFEIEAEAQILFRYESNAGADEDFDPLELDRFSNMQQLSRSLVESMGDLRSIKGLLENYTRESEILLLQQSRVSSELQEGLVRTRLVPFTNAVPRLRRIVRQTAKELDKQADFKIQGAEGEMDRTVLDRVVPALEHMLRNAIGHGIELPEDRLAANKPETGRILLNFHQEGPKIIIRIQDDGAGMNLEAIRKKAIERGLMTHDSDLTDNEVMQFVLESGFSTAEKVTQISGRGVGMDVVNTEIKQVNGTLHIDTKEGKGSIFTIQLPLTVSANQALLIETGEEQYALPLSSVDGVIRVSGKELAKLYDEDKPIYQYGGRKYGFFHLGTILGVAKPQLPEPGEKVPLILARAGDHSVALLVERIVGRQEIVIKSVGPQISTVNGISGATIMGDGRVALIIDISSLIREGMAHFAKVEVERERIEAEKAAAASAIPTVMIVDDSITVRKVTERLLKRHNYQFMTAKDGIDALDKLQDQIPDVMLLDIEMPRMDGFELATAMRNDDRLKDIPIIMITSRTGDKHRDRATKIGVNAYLGKPFQETELLENIESLLNSSE